MAVHRLIEVVPSMIRSAVIPNPSPATMARYHRLGARIITTDPGIDTVLERCSPERPAAYREYVTSWYARPDRDGPPVPELSDAASRAW